MRNQLCNDFCSAIARLKAWGKGSQEQDPQSLLRNSWFSTRFKHFKSFKQILPIIPIASKRLDVISDSVVAPGFGPPVGSVRNLDRRTDYLRSSWNRCSQQMRFAPRLKIQSANQCRALAN